MGVGTLFAFHRDMETMQSLRRSLFGLGVIVAEVHAVIVVFFRVLVDSSERGNNCHWI